MLSYILPLLALVIVASGQSDCTPFGVRIQYGKRLIDPQST